MILFVAGLTVASACAQTGAPKGALDKAQILALQKKFQDASVAADLPALSALMADNATFIHGSGLVQSKAQYIDSITSGQMKLTTYELKESKVTFFKDGAIVVALTDVGLAPPRNAAPGTLSRLLHMRVSTVWLRKLDGWQLVLNQGTPLAGLPPAAANR
ncbi:MAG: nuclear transport factor 2 family protein [Candidatus Acidiferrales bacterium]